jgi:hypothetical protein
VLTRERVSKQQQHTFVELKDVGTNVEKKGNASTIEKRR